MWTPAGDGLVEREQLAIHTRHTTLERKLSETCKPALEICGSSESGSTCLSIW
jgi:hypothetical protein